MSCNPTFWTLMYIYMYMYMYIVHVLMRDKKVEGSKENIRLKRSNKLQGKATKHTQCSHLSKEKIAASGGTRTHNTVHSTRIRVHVQVYMQVTLPVCFQFLVGRSQTRHFFSSFINTIQILKLITKGTCNKHIGTISIYKYMYSSRGSTCRYMYM